MTLADALKLRGLTPDHVAGLARLNPATVYRLLSGASANPLSSTVEQLEFALALPPGTLHFRRAADPALGGEVIDGSVGVQAESVREGSAK